MRNTVRTYLGPAGFSLAWACYFVAVFNYPLFTFTTPETRANNLFNMSMLTSLASFLIVIGLMLLFKQKNWDASTRKYLAVCACVIQVIGVTFGFIPNLLPFEKGIVSLTAGTMTGFALCVLLCLWMMEFCKKQALFQRYVFPLSFALGAFIAFLTLFLPVVISAVCMICFILMSYTLLIERFRQQAAGSVNEEQDDTQRERNQPKDLRRNILGYGLCTVILSLIYALIGQIVLSAPAGYDITNKLTVFTVVMAALLVALIEFALKNRSDYALIYKIVFLIIATGLLFMPLFGERYWIVFNVLVVLAFYLFLIRFLLLVVVVYQGNPRRGAAAFSIVAGLTFGVSLLGVLSGYLLKGSNGFGAVQLLSVAFASVYLLSMGLIPLIRKNRKYANLTFDDVDWDTTKLTVTKSMQTLNSNIQHSLEKPLWSFSDIEMKELCDSFGSHYKLTTREREVLPYVLRGKTSTEISKELVVSQSTVKGHMRTLYKKCGVHSKAELLSAVEKDRLALRDI